jgi:pimeloyl-ACP methyl ester carboxylesterase
MPIAHSADGAQLYYESQGRGPALLLLAGQCCDHREWTRVAQDLATQFQVIVWDYRGTGQSDKPAAPAYSTRGFAADALAVLDDLEVAQAHVYGISMGGRVAQWLAIDHPHRLRSLVLGATTPGNAHGVQRPAAVDKALRSADVVALLETSFTPAWITANRALADEIAALWAAPLPAHARRLHYQASEDHNAWDNLPGITHPTLVIHGTDDQVNLPSNAHLLAQRIAGAELHLLLGARHGYFEEMREASFAAVRDFLLRHSG